MIFSKSLRFSGAAVGAVAALSAYGAQTAHADTILKSGDRVVFYGDSITEQRLYTRYIQQYIYCRYPKMKLNFYNAGWGGDTTVGALARLDRDVLVLKPTVVTLFFGMNDGHYTNTDASITDLYRQNLEAIITKLQANNVRVIVFTPGAVDPDKNPHLGEVHYNDNLAALGQAAIDLAKKHNCAYVDVHTPMLAYQTEHKAKDPKFFMIPDGVHPDPSGHLVMANIMLAGFNVDPMPDLGTVDVKSGTGSGLRVASKSGSVFNIEAQNPSVAPFWIDGGNIGAAQDSGFADRAEQRLTVKGLPKGTYSLNIDGGSSNDLTSDELAKGVKIAGTYSVAGQRIHDLTNKKENLYFTSWRDIRLPLTDIAGVDAAYNDLIAADGALTSAIYAQAAGSAKSAITLSRLPSGPNLAQGKTYTASDPNVYNYGYGALTDGSWEANGQHCFASGDKDTFPKTATIDLGNSSKVASILLGVPAFGATKTIEVQVSTDGTQFTSVGSHTFDEAKEARYTYSFPAVDARYIRLSYPDHYKDGHGYSPLFSFTTECAVYAAEK